MRGGETTGRPNPTQGVRTVTIVDQVSSDESKTWCGKGVRSVLDVWRMDVSGIKQGGGKSLPLLGCRFQCRERVWTSRCGHE